MIFSSSIPANIRAPIPITQYLARRFTYHSAGEWSKLIDDGRVSINGKHCGVNDTIKAGDTLSYEPYEFEEPDADLSYSIIYEDEWLLGVNKPANLLVHRAGKSFRNNLIYHLRNVRTPTFPNCTPIHRLDRDTSGVVLIAQNPEQATVFGNLFRDGQVTKIYKALVKGRPDIKTPFMIDAPVSADRESGHPCKFRVDKDGKPASTIIEDIKHLNSNVSMMTVKPITGRTHQIRIHLASTGFPIIGDKLYGCDVDDKITRQALHCETLSLLHPHTGRDCVITAGLPDDMMF